METDVIKHEFVDAIPEKIQERTLYISIEFATAVHKCCCGCHQEVITPLSPTDWKVTFDGVSVSLSPSIGNWSFSCQSHYWIVRDRIKWSEKWSREQISTGRDNDQFNKHQYHRIETELAETATAATDQVGIWSRLRTWFSRV